ncbi:MAG: YsnF/AvaK domain-containing protein [Candidatus Eremiobacteraeota bacterium]|nr:YsnF/AvaK domain-containing protein [Candidatus Eremiobacteraeota bacterium]
MSRMEARWWIAAAFANEDEARVAVPRVGSLAINRSEMWVANAKTASAKRFADEEGIQYTTDGSGLERWLFDRGFASSYAKELAEELSRGRWILTINGRGDAPAVIAALKSAGARIPQSTDSSADTREVRIPLRREQLDVATYVVHDAEVSVHKEIITEIHRFEVPVVREELVIQRYPAGVTEPSIERIVLQHEQLRLTKRTVVDEEVVVRRERSYVDQHIEQALRAETVRIQTVGDVPLHVDGDASGLLLSSSGTTSSSVASDEGKTVRNV